MVKKQRLILFVIYLMTLFVSKNVYRREMC
jgi:hypothetical protein